MRRSRTFHMFHFSQQLSAMKFFFLLTKKLKSSENRVPSFRGFREDCWEIFPRETFAVSTHARWPHDELEWKSMTCMESGNCLRFLHSNTWFIQLSLFPSNAEPFEMRFVPYKENQCHEMRSTNATYRSLCHFRGLWIDLWLGEVVTMHVRRILETRNCVRSS